MSDPFPQRVRTFRGGWARRWRKDAPVEARPLWTPRGPRREIPRPYCLFCYAPMPEFEGAVQACPRCGRRNLACDQGVFWTRERRLRELEEVAKALIVLAIGGMTALLLTSPGGSGTGQGWAVGAPILLAAYLWETAGKITRWTPELRGWIVWTIFLFVPGFFAMPVIAGIALEFEEVPDWIAFLAPVALAPAAAVPFLARAFDRWRVRRILDGVERARAELEASAR